MQQWSEAKALHPDAILFFRFGDFYEMFREDAVIASQLLGITLTSRNKEDPKSDPMAGVPHHAAHGYVSRLLAAGQKVAICEQLADPKKTKGIVPRGVVRVVTPGLVTDDDQLDARDNHYLAAVEQLSPDSLGVALLDLSTGELLAASVSSEVMLIAELCRANPRELLVGPGLHALAASLQELLPATTLRSEQSLMESADAVLGRVLGADALKDAVQNHAAAARAASARALAFAAVCSPRFGVPVRRVALLDVSHTMHLDATAQAHLEIARASDGSRRGTLLASIDRTVTSGGARALKRRILGPLTDVAAIRKRLATVELFVVHGRVRAEVRELLAKMPDLERIAVKVALGQASPRDLGLLRDGLELAPKLVEALFGLPAGERDLAGIQKVDLAADLAARLSHVLSERPPVTDREPGIVRDGVDKALDEARALQRNGTELIVLLEKTLREETGAQGLRVKYNSVFGWYIEVTKSQLGKVPSSFRRKQTVATGERYSSERLDQLAADLESAEERARTRELVLWEDVVARARECETRVRDLAASFAEWDVAAALAEVAHQLDYAKPEVDDSEIIDIEEGRHPVVEEHVEKGHFVPNDTLLDRAKGRLFLVTGPNMAGKSTLMRQVALITVMAQAGSYVPAKRARIGIVDRLLSRVGASDNLARGQSTFMVEMIETASILRHATHKSLVVLDEIGRGTSTYDGLAIAWAVAEHMHDVVQCRALFATHYHELTELAKTAPHVVNVSVSAREHDGGIVFLHRLVDGPASRSYGIAVAKLAGLPEGVLDRARALLETFEGEGQKKGRSERSSKRPPQLGLFEPASERGVSVGERAALTALANVDVDRMTPLDALTLLSTLKQKLRG